MFVLFVFCFGFYANANRKEKKLKENPDLYLHTSLAYLVFDFCLCAASKTTVVSEETL